MKQIGIFDETKALERLSQLGDKLEWLNAVINWNIFVPLLDQAKPDMTQTPKGGRPPLSNPMMFKVLKSCIMLPMGQRNIKSMTD